MKLPPDQFPAVFVTIADMDGEFWTNATNLRAYAYKVDILFQIGNTPSSVTEDRMQYAEDAVAQVVDEIINVIDSDYELGEYGLVRYIEAVDCTFDEVEYEGGYAKHAKITINVKSEFFV